MVRLLLRCFPDGKWLIELVTTIPCDSPLPKVILRFLVLCLRRFASGVVPEVFTVELLVLLSPLLSDLPRFVNLAHKSHSFRSSFRRCFELRKAT